MVASQEILDVPPGARVNPKDFVRAAMEWHFNPKTGSAYWLDRAKRLDFDPRKDVKTMDDLTLFPNRLVDELRDVRAEDLIPRGYGPHPDVIGVYESGGTTGPPKRVVALRDWIDRSQESMDAGYDAHGLPRDVNWLIIFPTGPHIVGESKRQAARRGGLAFTIDMDPRWVKKRIAAGKVDEADAYANHLIEQATFLLRTQDIGILHTTPPLLERIARSDELVGLINTKVKGIIWGGAHMDADSRHLYRTEIFPNVKLVGSYGSTMILGGTPERPGLTEDDPCIFDPQSPFITFRVVDPDTGRTVAIGERGQVVMTHVSRNMLLPNNLERDLATRIEHPEGLLGDSVADVSPVARFDNEPVIEGVY